VIESGNQECSNGDPSSSQGELANFNNRTAPFKSGIDARFAIDFFPDMFAVLLLCSCPRKNLLPLSFW